jgi:predicted TIM-barrel fold metal-dependent hydrolase
MLNWYFGWGLILGGLLTGVCLSLLWYRKEFLESHAAFRRRFLRLGLIAMAALGAINVLYSFSRGASEPSLESSVASIGFIVAGAAMPALCFLTAWRAGFRRLFFLPVCFLAIAVVQTLRVGPTETRRSNMKFIDAHVHVWSSDTARYPVAAGFDKESVQPHSFTPDELFRHTRPAGVGRINLIQISFYGFDNSYMLDAIAQHPDAFVGTAVINPLGNHPEREMDELAKRGVRAFRIHPKLSEQPIERWLRPEGYRKMFAAGARNNQAMSCLIGPDGLPELERMCAEYPDTPVIIDHLCRVGADGLIRDADVDRLCGMAKHKKVLLKVGAFYALGKKQPPYTDLAALISRVVAAFGSRRCMWESDSPFQVQGQHTYQASLDLVRRHLEFLSDDDKEWLLWKTAENCFFTR